MWKDPKIQLAAVSFLVFFLTWGLLSLIFKIDATNPFLAFIASATTTAWNLIMVFIKPDGGIDTPKESAPPEEEK
ncbi:hypothetical protein UFOVP138_40 [uncultured Caudovirales phage]|uniref:Uncharacterized protein n=1 Tax=uncultured Caudovirales phage TaxID=2100421 RepID=A0A6J5LKD8_9CAUD|nr:hypothetical protein UFOVP138_40 [uncultured Caudovirales phage]